VWTDPGVVHFYSYATGVSLELPVGFEAVGEDDVSAEYADRADDGPVTSETPAVRIRVVGDVDDDDDAGAAAALELADGFAAAGSIGRHDRVIDGFPAVTVVSRDGARLLHQTAVAADGRLLSVIAVSSDDGLLPAYDAAVDSIRFIRL
jgi:hypothetical protein